MKTFSYTSRLWIFCLGLSLAFQNGLSAEEPFRPEVGKFPPVDKSLAYRGEIVFIDHANRRGSIRVQGS